MSTASDDSSDGASVIAEQFDELKFAAQHGWNLESQKLLIQALGNLQHRTMSRFTQLKRQVDGLCSDTESTSIALQNVFNAVSIVSNQQFVQNRIADDAEGVEKHGNGTATDNGASSVVNGITNEEKVRTHAKAIAERQEALELCEQVLRERTISLNGSVSSLGAHERCGLRRRQLAYIGSKTFLMDPYAGYFTNANGTDDFTDSSSDEGDGRTGRVPPWMEALYPSISASPTSRAVNGTAGSKSPLTHSAAPPQKQQQREKISAQVGSHGSRLAPALSSDKACGASGRIPVFTTAASTATSVAPSQKGRAAAKAAPPPPPPTPPPQSRRKEPSASALNTIKKDCAKRATFFSSSSSSAGSDSPKGRAALTAKVVAAAKKPASSRQGLFNSISSSSTSSSSNTDTTAAGSSKAGKKTNKGHGSAPLPVKPAAAPTKKLLQQPQQKRTNSKSIFESSSESDGGAAAQGRTLALRRPVKVTSPADNVGKSASVLQPVTAHASSSSSCSSESCSSSPAQGSFAPAQGVKKDFLPKRFSSPLPRSSSVSSHAKDGAEPTSYSETLAQRHPSTTSNSQPESSLPPPPTVFGGFDVPLLPSATPAVLSKRGGKILSTSSDEDDEPKGKPQASSPLTTEALAFSSAQSATPPTVFGEDSTPLARRLPPLQET